MGYTWPVWAILGLYGLYLACMGYTWPVWAILGLYQCMSSRLQSQQLNEAGHNRDSDMVKI